MVIHTSDPFATPEGARSPLRQLRGRLAAPVALWTASAPKPVGLTVSSMLVVDGDPGRVLGIVDEESTLWEAVRRTGRFAVAPLNHHDQQLADVFAGLMPAPGGAFVGRSWQDTDYGPVLEGVTSWAGCRLDGSRPMGWGLLVEATVERVEILAGALAAPLIHYRGRYLGGV